MSKRDQVHSYCIRQLQKYLSSLEFTRRSRQEMVTRAKRFLNSTKHAQYDEDEETQTSLLHAAREIFGKANIQNFLLHCRGSLKTINGYARTLNHSRHSLGMQSSSYRLQDPIIQSPRCKHYDLQDWKTLRVFCQSASDISVRDQLFGLLFIHTVAESPELPLPIVLNALAKTTVDQVNESCLRTDVGDVASVHGLLLLDQAPLKLQSIPKTCATLLQSYITGGDAEPWKLRHTDDALFGGMDGHFLFPDYSRWNRDGFHHLPTQKAAAIVRRLMRAAGLPIYEGLTQVKITRSNVA